MFAQFEQWQNTEKKTARAGMSGNTKQFRARRKEDWWVSAGRALQSCSPALCALAKAF